MKHSTLVTLKKSTVRVDRGGGVSKEVPIDRTSPGSVAKCTYELLSEVGAISDRLLLGVDSPDVFFVEREADRNGTQDHQALCYELEADLPLDAEAMAAVCVGSRGKRSSFLVWGTEGVEEVVRCLAAEYELSFSAYVPVELCLAEQQRITGDKIAGDKESVLICHENGVERFGWDQRGLTEWSYFPRETEINKLGDETTYSIVEPERREELLQQFLSGGERMVHNLNCDFSEVVPFSSRVAGSVWQPLLVGSLMFLTCLFGAMLWRSLQAEDTARLAESEVVASFRSQFPGQRINGPVKKLLENELAEIKKRSSFENHSTTSSRLLTRLQQLLAGFDKKVRFQISSLSIEENAVVVSGNVKNFSDFQSLKEHFSQNGFVVGTESTFGTPFSISLTPGSTNLDSGGRQ